MKKTLMIILASSLLMAGCFKDSVHNNADTTAVVAIFNGGPDELANVPLNLTAGGDSSLFYIEAGVTSPYTLNKDITITLEINDAARVAYNQTHTVQYDAFPDSLYSFTTLSAVLPAGSRSVNIPIIIYSAKGKLTPNYMLPITIKDAQGANISSDSGTIYYNQLGSPIAGRYLVTGTRINYNGPVSGGDIASITDLSEIGTKISSTVNTYQVLIDYADLGSAGWQYIVNLDPADKTISIQPNSVMIHTATGFMQDSFKIDIQEYNAATRTFHLKTEYSDLSGNARVVEEFLASE